MYLQDKQHLVFKISYSPNWGFSPFPKGHTRHQHCTVSLAELSQRSTSYETNLLKWHLFLMFLFITVLHGVLQKLMENF